MIVDSDLAGMLHRFGIQCPQINPDNKRYVITWFNFLLYLAPLALNNDLKNARNLWTVILSKSDGSG